MNWKPKLHMLITAAMFVAGAVILYRIRPEHTWWMPPCLFHEITGLYCPGCGTGRGFHKLLHGDLAGAWHMNPLTVLLIPLTVYLVAVSYVRKPDGTTCSPPNWIGWAVLVVIVLFWIARNIPVYPFTVLAPH